MLFFTNKEVFREAGVMLESARDRDHCSRLIYMVNFIVLHLLKSILHVGVDGFASRCNNIVLFPPIGWVEYLPAFGLGAD